MDWLRFVLLGHLGFEWSVLGEDTVRVEMWKAASIPLLKRIADFMERYTLQGDVGRPDSGRILLPSALPLNHDATEIDDHRLTARSSTMCMWLLRSADAGPSV